MVMEQEHTKLRSRIDAEALSNGALAARLRQLSTRPLEITIADRNAALREAAARLDALEMGES